MKLIKTIFILIFFLTARSEAGVESVQLDYVALDSSVECNRILFQSSQHFKKTLFVIPRVVAGTGVESGRTYNITPNLKAGYYDLRVNLYFPANDEALKTSSASISKKDAMACNWDKVKYSINQNISDPQQKIQTISRIPLTSIEVKISGFKNSGLIGRAAGLNEESDILDYYGKSLTVQFTISEAEKNLFQSQLVSQEGLSAIIKFRFQARSRNGSVYAQVNLQNLAEKFSATASLKKIKWIAAADLSFMLKSSITENSIQIISESSTSAETSKVTQILIDKILKEVSFSNSAPEVDKTDTTDLSSKKGLVSVDAVIDILKNKMSSEISFNSVTAPENATAQTEIKLKADRLNDPNTTEVTISAGHIDPSSGVILNAGETLTITPAFWYLDKIEYKEFRSYLTLGEIQNLNLASHFDDLTDQNMKIKDIAINGTLLAEGEWTPFSDANSIASPNRYRWARVTKTAQRLRDSSMNVPPRLEALKQLPLLVTFSALGDRNFVKLSDLMVENPFWNCLYDDLTGRLILTAKQDLGVLRFRDRMFSKEELQYASQPLVLDQVFQQKTNIFGQKNYTENFILSQDPRPIVLQKSFVLFVSRPKVMRPQEIRHLLDKQKVPIVIP